MLRTGGSSSRQLLRQATSSASGLARSRTGVAARAGAAGGGVRYQSTAVPRRSFKNGLARWAIAIGGTYWYMTSPIFNDEPAYVIQDNKESEPQLQTIQSVKPARKFTPPHPADAPVVPSTPTSNSPPSINPKSDDPPPSNNPLPTYSSSPNDVEVDPEHALALEQEASQQGAFNEETGEINWDCPCLGGMAHGPCGEQFRDAFSCFVYSEAEPKGMDCVDKFERMQLCFREHPEIYAEEIADDDRIAEEVKGGGSGGSGDEASAGAPAGAPAPAAKNGPDVDQPSVWTPLANEQEQQQQPKGEKQDKTQAPAVSKEQPRDYNDLKSGGANNGEQLEVQRASEKLRSESSEIVPKAAHDARK